MGKYDPSFAVAHALLALESSSNKSTELALKHVGGVEGSRNNTQVAW
ncbi:hypothetical protein PC128_g18801 [Phytophthora cactorum]|nr:hypothetical protein PC128_g18801 [Phytophthora cactorum]